MTEQDKTKAGLLYNPNTDEKYTGKTGKTFGIIAPFCYDYDYEYNIEIGNEFFANHNCVILDGAKVKFGSNVFIGPNCCFTTAGHPLDVEQRNEGRE